MALTLRRHRPGCHSDRSRLAWWRLHGIGPAMHAAWQAGVVLMGVSAGSVCWFAGGTTDAFGLPLRPVTDAWASSPTPIAPTTTPRNSGVPRSTG
jgi:hypothetical protein